MVLFKLLFFSWCPLLVCYILTYRISRYIGSSKLIIETIAQKVMASSSFGHRFRDLIYFEVEFVCHVP